MYWEEQQLAGAPPGYWLGLARSGSFQPTLIFSNGASSICFGLCVCRVSQFSVCRSCFSAAAKRRLPGPTMRPSRSLRELIRKAIKRRPWTRPWKIRPSKNKSFINRRRRPSSDYVRIRLSWHEGSCQLKPWLTFLKKRRLAGSGFEDFGSTTIRSSSLPTNKAVVGIGLSHSTLPGRVPSPSLAEVRLSQDVGSKEHLAWNCQLTRFLFLAPFCLFALAIPVVVLSPKHSASAVSPVRWAVP